MDGKKLSDAPWWAIEPDGDVFQKSWRVGSAEDENGQNRCELIARMICTFSDQQATAEFIALARNAFDVMLRRGWGVQAFNGPGYHPGGSLYSWQAIDGNGNWVGTTTCSDPFAALVEADRSFRQTDQEG